MRWKLMRRRLSVSAPRMIVRSHLPWPLRWAVVALMLGFSAAIAAWAFEFGKDIAGLDKGAKEELTQLRIEVAQLKAERERTLSVANTADSLLKAEKASQERLAQQLKQIEAENLAMKADLGFFERLLPAGASSGLSIRGFQAETKAPGQIRFTLLVMQPGKSQAEFRGNYELTLQGTLDGKPWSFTPPNGSKPLQLKQYLRVEGMVEHPPAAVVKTMQIRVLDASGGLRATQTAKL
jgi:hypothetical protein